MKPKRNGPLQHSNKPSVWQGCSVGWLARRSSRTTGRNGKPKSANCTSTSPMCEKISCTRPRTDRISKSHAVVVVEDLQVKNLSKSAKKNVKANPGLNRAILDASPFELRRLLEYKALWRGGLLIAVPLRTPAALAPTAAMYQPRTARRKRKFVCVECGFSANADFVAACNIREAGLALLACAYPSGDVSPSWQLTGPFLTQRDKKRESELESIIPVSLISRGRGSPLLNADPDRFCSKRELPMQYDCLYPTSRGSLQPRFRLGCRWQGTDPPPLSEVLVRFDYWARLAEQAGS